MIWCAFAPPPYEAAALVAVEAGVGAPAAYEVSALRALAASDAVLRRAALSPEAASAVARAARPGAAAPFLALFAAAPDASDTLSRAADLLAARIEVAEAPGGRGVRIVARMDERDAAAAVANAVAVAVAAAHNEATAKIDRRLDRTRAESLARAERRRDGARARLASLRAADAAPTGSFAAPASSNLTPAALTLAEARRAAAAAEIKRAEAARIYGPRHPEMIQIETEARRAAATLQAASAKAAAAAAASPAPRAEGGPDPRGPALADAQDELDRAETAYLREAESLAAPEREAQVIAPAKPPPARANAPASLTVAASALLGFLLFGAAPALGAAAGRMPSTKPLALLLDGSLDPTSAHQIVEALDIGASTGARRVRILGADDTIMRVGARAVVEAAIESGWRPLLMIAGVAATRVASRGAIACDGRVYATMIITTRGGPLVVAGARMGSRAAPDVDLAFDLVVFDASSEIAADVSIWIGADPPARYRAAGDALLWISVA